MAHMPFAQFFMVMSVIALIAILWTLKAKEAAHIIAALLVAVLIAEQVWTGTVHIAWGIAMIAAIFMLLMFSSIGWKGLSGMIDLSELIERVERRIGRLVRRLASLRALQSRKDG